jgi:hypothetical protein
MRVASNGVGSEVECTECNPPRRFKSKSGLNGHTQFKHGRLPDNRAVVPNGKQSQMYEDLTELVEQGFDEVRYRLDSLANENGNGQANENGNGQGNGNGNGQGNGNGNGQGNGNGNGQGNGNGNGQGNGNGYNTEPIGIASPPKDEPKDEPNYYCEDCDCRDLTLGQPYCPGCGHGMDWSGYDVPLVLDKSGL